MNPQNGETEDDNIFLGVIPISPATCNDFKDILELLVPGNAAIFFYVSHRSTMGHYVTIWTIEDSNGKLFYFFHDAIVGLIGADTADQMETKIRASGQHRKIYNGAAYHRTIYIFNLPVNQIQRAQAIKRVCVRINKRGNEFLDTFLGLRDTGLVTLPHNFMRECVATEDMTEVEDISESTTSDVTDDFTKLHETPETDEDDAVSDSRKERRIISYPYRNPSAQDGASVKPSGTSAHSKTLQKGDYVAHLSNVYFGLMVSEVMDARCDRDSAGREFPNITLHSGHVLKSDDWIRKLDARFLNDHKWDSKSGTPHQVYEFIWCGGESADTAEACRRCLQCSIRPLSNKELQNQRSQIMIHF